MKFKFLNKLFEKYTDGGFDITTFNEFKSDKSYNNIFSQNKDAVYELLNFLSNESKIFSLTGFRGAGKTVITNQLFQVVKSDVLILKFNFFISSTVDDIFLTFFELFKQYHSMGKLKLPKTEYQELSQKTLHCIKNAQKPILIIFDSMEMLMAERNIKEVFDFINHILTFENVKIIFSSRNFNLKKNLKFGLTLRNTILKPFTQEGIEEFFNNNETEYNENLINKIYALSRGHYIYIYLVMTILKKTNIMFEDFLSKINVEDQNFDDYIIRNILSIVSPTQLNLLNFLCISRYAINEDKLLEQEDATKEDLEYLVSCYLLQKENNIYFIKDYIKELLRGKIPNISLVKFNKFYRQFYENQLSKNPTQREILISRQTARNEIKHHESILNRLLLATVPITKREINFSYMNFSKKEEEKTTKVKEKNKTLDIKPKNDVALTKEELNLLSNNETIEKEAQYLDFLFEEENSKKLEIQVEEETDYLILAKEAKDNFDFSNAIKYYKTYIGKTDKSERNAKSYVDLAICYVKINMIENAISAYEMAIEYFKKENDKQNASQMIYEIAKLNQKTYKTNTAKNLYLKILEDKNENTVELNIRCLLSLIDLSSESENPQIIVKYSKELIEFAKNCQNESLIAEIHFKYAILLDDFGKTDDAINHYLKCIQYEKNNHYLIDACINLGMIYQDDRKINDAVNYYLKALEKGAKNNDENAYQVYTKLALIYKIKDFDRAINYIKKALFHAQKSEDDFFISSCYLDFGDIFYFQKQDKKALTCYLKAEKIAISKYFIDLEKIIETRLKDMKIKLGEEQYEKSVTANYE